MRLTPSWVPPRAILPGMARGGIGQNFAPNGLAVAGGAALGSAALGVLVSKSVVLAILFVAAGISLVLLSLLGVSLQAGLVGLVGAGQLVLGPLLIQGSAPKSVSFALDLVILGLFFASIPGWPRIDRKVSIALGVFLALCLVEALNPLLPSVGYSLAGLRAIALPVATIFAVAGLGLTRRDRHFVVALLFAAWVINVYFATRQWLVGFSLPELSWIENSNSTFLVGTQVRLLGAQQSNQDFGYACAVALPALTALALAMRGRLRIVIAGLAGLSLLLLAATLLRSTLVGGIAGVLLFAGVATSVDRRRLIAGGVMATILLSLLIAAAPSSILPNDKVTTLRERAASIFDPFSQSSVQARQDETYPRAIAAVSGHPLGAGVGSAGPLSQVRSENAPLGSVVPDNGYLVIAIQLGVVGLFVFVWLLFQLGRSLAQGARRGSYICAAAFGSTGALAIAMLAGSYWSLLAPATLWAILVGLGLGESSSDQDTRWPESS